MYKLNEEPKGDNEELEKQKQELEQEETNEQIKNTTYKGTYILTQNETLDIVAKDIAGNKTTKVEYINYIDDEKPEIQVTKSIEEPTKENITLTMQVTDNKSGLQSVTISGIRKRRN